MIDHISITCNVPSVQPFLANKNIKWVHNVDNDTAELKKHVGKCRNFYLTMFDGEKPKMELRNSIHEFWHGNNYTDFHLCDYLAALECMKNDLGIDPEKAELHAFEFGVNIETDVLPPQIFTNYVEHKGERFKPMSKKAFKVGNSRAKGVVCEKSHLDIKVYDKGTQYGLDRYLMRFELKFKEMQPMRKVEISIYHLSDLGDPKILEQLQTFLMKYYDDVMKVSRIDLEKATPKQRDFMKLAQHPTQWIEWKRDFSSNTYRQRKATFLRLSKQIKMDNTHDIIRDKIVEKWQLLTTEKKALIAESTQLRRNLALLEGNLPNESAAPTLLMSLNFSQIMALTDSQKERFDKDQCVMCGIDVSTKKKGVLTCSKKCRNAKSNSYQDHLKKIRKDKKQDTLFDADVFLKVEILEHKKSVRLNNM